ncbi:ABC transporter substrate-binding protein [Sphaerimonospora sp. CA-214678]|uniref:ABC transporter substrate-binding protein n=1 Tax=Sphaerimonospora sp. CA-214678 TaxID=3240029 RepID=UPI003D8CCFC4
MSLRQQALRDWSDRVPASAEFSGACDLNVLRETVNEKLSPRRFCRQELEMTAHFPRLAAYGVVAALVLTTAACGSSADRDAPSEGQGTGQVETLKVMMFPGQTYKVPLTIAKDQGYLADAGIAIEEVTEPSNMTGPQGLKATNSQIGIWATSDMVRGWQAGFDVAFFCGSLPYLETTLMTAPGSDLPSTKKGDSWKDVLQGLSGKTVGIQTPVGSGMHVIFESVMAAYGVDDITYVTTGVDPAVQAASLGKGTVDVIQASPSTTQHLEVTKAAEPILYLPDGPPEYREFYGSGWAASREWLDANPKLASGFCSAVEQGLRFIQDEANADTVKAILAEELGIKNEAVASEVRQTFSAYSVDIDRATFTNTLDRFTDMGLLKAEPKPSFDDVVWTSS